MVKKCLGIVKDRQDREMLYGPTNEELVTDIFRSSIKSYNPLPQLLYHIQWKFRDEIRSRCHLRDVNFIWKMHIHLISPMRVCFIFIQ